MKLRNIKGNTYMFNGGTNTGIYLFENNDALLIDRSCRQASREDYRYF